MTLKVQQTDQFKAALEEALYWLYSNNLEQSQEFADRKFLELQREVEELANHLRQTPLMGPADEISGLRRFPVYGGRYSVTWLVDDELNLVTLTEFLDSKYPQNLREFKFDD